MQAALLRTGHAPIITSVDGIGPVLGAELLADTGGDPVTAFGTTDRLADYAGLAPVPRDSGRVRSNLHRPQRYHRGLRRVFYLAALSAIKRPNRPSRAFTSAKATRERDRSWVWADGATSMSETTDSKTRRTSIGRKGEAPDARARRSRP